MKTRMRPELVAADIPLDIRYEDDYLLVISKQAGLVCHPAEGHYGDTLVNALIAHCGKENLCDVQGEQDRLASSIALIVTRAALCCVRKRTKWALRSWRIFD